jgi:hypothetical protein
MTDLVGTIIGFILISVIILPLPIAIYIAIKH